MVSKREESKGAVEAAINWADITDLNAARAVLGNVINASDILGDGAEFIEDKNVLVKVPFLILDWKFITDEKSGREYVNVLIMGVDGTKGRFNDGSTGVYAQLKQVSEQVGKVGIECKHGLRRSDYTKEGVGEATTYYLAV